MTCKNVRDSVATESPTQNRNGNIEHLALAQHSENPPISQGVRVDRMASGQTLCNNTFRYQVALDGEVGGCADATVGLECGVDCPEDCVAIFDGSDEGVVHPDFYEGSCGVVSDCDCGVHFGFLSLACNTMVTPYH
jgi:hypothetical protein